MARIVILIESVDRNGKPEIAPVLKPGGGKKAMREFKSHEEAENFVNAIAIMGNYSSITGRYIDWDE